MQSFLLFLALFLAFASGALCAVGFYVRSRHTVVVASAADCATMERAMKAAHEQTIKAIMESMARNSAPDK